MNDIGVLPEGPLSSGVCKMTFLCERNLQQGEPLLRTYNACAIWNFNTAIEGKVTVEARGLMTGKVLVPLHSDQYRKPKAESNTT